MSVTNRLTPAQLRRVTVFGLAGLVTAGMAVAGAEVRSHRQPAGSASGTESAHARGALHRKTQELASNSGSMLHFSIVKKRSTRTDSIVAPPKALAALTTAGVAVGNAHRVFPSRQSRFWIAPGANGTLCEILRPMIQPSVRYWCYSSAAATSGATVGVQGIPPHVEVNGLVPDGVTSVTVHFADGTATHLPVNGNAYDGVVSRATASISYSTATGARHLTATSCTADC